MLDFKTLAKEALALPPKKRAALLDKLADSLEPMEDGKLTEVELAWKEEIERRVQALESGAVRVKSGEEVLRGLKRKYGA